MSGIRPRLRPLEVVPEGRGDDARMVLRDRDGWTPPVALPPGAVLLASLMDGTRTLSEIQNDYLALAGLYWPLDDLEQLVRRLDSAFLLDNARFQEFRRPEVQAFLRSRTRPAVGAGVAYPADRFELVSRLDALLGGNRNRVCDGARQSARRLRGVASPAGALSDGNAAYAAAFRRLSEESDADLFVILAACRRPMREPFCLLSKDFETPLGRTSVDRDWIDAFAGHYAALRCASREPLFHDALRHRTETAIELQTVLLQHVFAGPRDFRIVPILLGDLTPAPSPNAIESPGVAASGRALTDSPEVQAFLTAMRVMERESTRRVCYLLSADLVERDWLAPPHDDTPAYDDCTNRSASAWGSSHSHLLCVRRGWREAQLFAELTGAVETERLTPDEASDHNGDSNRPAWFAAALYGIPPANDAPPASRDLRIE